MGKTVLDVSQKYQAMDPRVMRDILRSKRARAELDSETIGEMTTAMAVRYWPPEVRQVYSLVERGRIAEDLYEAAEDEYGLTRAEVDDALEYAEKVGWMKHSAVVEWQEYEKEDTES